MNIILDGMSLNLDVLFLDEGALLESLPPAIVLEKTLEIALKSEGQIK